jgi:uncharacterized membrane protein YidH (DUF202 family)
MLLHGSLQWVATDHSATPGYSRGLVLASVGIFLYLCARACIQSVTIDEADSFLTFATGSTWAAWHPAAANHLLNTLLERLSWTVFGFNQVAMRLPALLGAVIYLASAVSICSQLAGRFFRVIVFVCLVLNPFVLDYLVAARGYALAVGFLLAAIALFWRTIDQVSRGGLVPLHSYAIASILLAFSFASNFSFAIADLLVGAALLIAAALSESVGLSEKDRPGSSLKRAALVAAAGVLPGLSVALFLCSSVLLHWNSAEFVYGARHLSEMWRSLYDASFPPPNHEIVNEVLYPVWSRTAISLCVAAVVLLCMQAAALFIIRRIRESIFHRPGALMAVALALVVLFTIGLHWIALHKISLLLPKARTALFFAPLLTLIFAAGGDALRHEPGLCRWSLPGTVILTLCAAYFLTCLRLHYFQQWRFNEDTKGVFWVARDIERRCDIHEFVTEWHYASTLNFYRRQYEDYTMKPFEAVNPGSFPAGKDSYIFWDGDGQAIIDSEGLKAWYRNAITGATVAVRACPQK